MDGNGNGNGNGKCLGDDGVSVIDYEKLVRYYQRMTETTADALEELIEKAAETDSLSSDELEEFREVLDSAREHVAGWKGPMRFRTRSEASRYVNGQNLILQEEKLDNRAIRLMKMIHEQGQVTVLI